MKYIALAIIASALVGFVWFVAFTDRSAKPWNEAQQANTIDGYQEFLKKYPKSSFQQPASNKLVQLLDDKAWSQLSTNTVSSIQQFIRDYPSSVYQHEARSILTNLFKMAWNDIRLRLDADTYSQFLAQGPPKILADEAVFMLSILESAKKREMSKLEILEATVSAIDVLQQQYAFDVVGPQRMGSLLLPEGANAVLSAKGQELLLQKTFLEGERIKLIIGPIGQGFGPYGAPTAPIAVVSASLNQ